MARIPMEIKRLTESPEIAGVELWRRRPQEPGPGRVGFTIGYLLFDLFLVGSISLIWWSALRTYGTDCFGMCDGCGYDLRAVTKGGPCPECGRIPTPGMNS